MQIQVKRVLEELNMSFSGINLNLEINLCLGLSQPIPIIRIAPELGTVRIIAMAMFCSNCHIAVLFIILIMTS